MPSPPAKRPGDTDAFLDGGGKAADYIRARDWSSHPLGPPATWPEGLRTALSLVLNSPESMILAWGPDLTFFFNDTYIPLLGPRIDWAMGAPFHEVWADGWDQAQPIIAQAMAGVRQRFVDLPWKLATDRGVSDTWWTFSYSRVLDSDGAVAGLFIFTNETTDRVIAATTGREAENRNRQILDSATDYAIIALDFEGRITRWNEGARRTLGWTEQEMLGEPIDRFFVPEDFADGRPATEMRIALETGRATDERWHLRKSGERFWANGAMTPLRDEHEAIIGFVKVLRDGTAQRLAEDALRASKAELDAMTEDLRCANAQLQANVAETSAELDRLWETSPDLLMTATLDGVVKAVNPAWRDILGWEAADLIDQPVALLLHPEDRAAVPTLLDGLRGGTIATVENRLLHRDGSYRWISWVAAPADKTIYATGRHITAEREAAQALRLTEEALRQSQKVEAVGQLTGGVAHDFNNLLTVIRGSVDLLRRPGVSDERRTRYINAIADTADRAAKLTSQLLAFARRQALTPEVFDAGANIVAVQDMLRTLLGGRVTIETHVADCPCLINADASQFDTAIVNMAVNARDAMAGNDGAGAGKLVIRVSAADGMPAVRSHPAVSGKFVTVALTDTGYGIAADQIDRIFEPFYTTKGVGQGTGLGLSQVFGFAKQSGGDIIVESEPGVRTTFTLYLPVAAVEHVTLDPDADGASPIGEGARVLVVEDNPDVGAFAMQALAELGYRSKLATDGAGALAALDAAQGQFDVVFSDVVMPGMSGIELGLEIRRTYPALPVMLASGYSSVLAEKGAQGFELLHKPYSIDALGRALRKIMA